MHCVKCARDTTAPVPNGTPASPTIASNTNARPADYQPVVNGDRMDSDEDNQEAGDMEVERAVNSNQMECVSRYY